MQIENTSNPQQAVYVQVGGTGPWLGGSGLTQQEINDIQVHGFVMSLRARIIQGPTYDTNSTSLVSGGIAVAGFSGFRFDIALGTDGLGNTQVILPSAVMQLSSAFSYPPFTMPLVVPGNDYHLYQLSYDPVSMTASLFVDGVLSATGFPGASARASRVLWTEHPPG